MVHGAIKRTTVQIGSAAFGVAGNVRLSHLLLSLMQGYCLFC